MFLQQASCHSSCRWWAKAAANTVKPNKDHQVIQAQRAHLDPRVITAGKGLQATRELQGGWDLKGLKVRIMSNFFFVQNKKFWSLFHLLIINWLKGKLCLNVFLTGDIGPMGMKGAKGQGEMGLPGPPGPAGIKEYIFMHDNNPLFIFLSFASTVRSNFLFHRFAGPTWEWRWRVSWAFRSTREAWYSRDPRQTWAPGTHGGLWSVLLLSSLWLSGRSLQERT